MLRRFGFALWLALAVVVGQQAAALHDLAHATERLGSQNDSVPAPQTCDKCFACANLAGGAAATPPPFPALDATAERPQQPGACPAPGAARFAFLSRAPPTLL